MADAVFPAASGVLRWVVLPAEGVAWGDMIVGIRTAVVSSTVMAVGPWETPAGSCDEVVTCVGN